MAFIERRTMTNCLLGIMLGTLGYAGLGPRALAGPSDLAAEFSVPPTAARPWVYWFWLNGNITREGITADLEAMQRVGIGGVLIVEVDVGIPKGPEAFASPRWREMFKHAIAEARRLGLEVSMNNDAGWCGSGGPWITPELSMQKVVWSETGVDGSRRFAGPLPRPEAVLGYYRDIAVLAFPTPAADADPKKQFRIDQFLFKSFLTCAQSWEPLRTIDTKPADVPAEAVIPRNCVVDLTSHLDKEGRLVWDVPAGKWTILRLGHTTTGKTNAPSPKAGEGLECDKLSKEAIDAQFAGLVAKLIADVGPDAAKTLSHTHVDSWEVGCQNWTPRMREQFQERRGYDPLSFLPAMTGRVVDRLDVSERFLWDLRKTVAELLNENYAGHLCQVAHEHGMQLTIEAYGGGPFDDLSYGGRADSPMAEFWTDPGCWGTAIMKSTKVMSSSAHTYGKTIVSAEAFTSLVGSARWTNHPFSLKPLGDVAFCNGVNRFVFHRYAHQPWLDRRPGMTMGPFGVHYERTETWWEQTRPWHEYLARCQHLLRQGRFVADLCCLQTEDVPHLWPPLASTVYDFDYCAPEVVLTRMRVQDGCLVLPDGMRYRVLVLPAGKTMTPALLAKIKELVEAGATAVGPRPVQSPSLSNYPKCDDEVRKLADALWGNCDGQKVLERRCGKGKIVWGKTPEAVLAEAGVPPDFQYSLPPQLQNAPSEVRCALGDRASVRYIHRTLDGTDVYFVANTMQHPMDLVCTFRVKGKRPEFWRPDTGKVQQIAAYNEAANGTEVPIRLEACGSVFVVFRPDVGKAPDHMVALSRDGKSVMAASTPAEIVVKKASYGVPGDPARTRDVTARVQQLVKMGTYAIHVASMAQGGDPAVGAVKTLTVEYAAGETLRNISGTDSEFVLLFEDNQPRDAEVRRDANGRLLLEAWKPGRYEVKMASGKMQHVDVPATPSPLDVAGPWDLRFPPGGGAPEHVTLEKLISWSQHSEPGVKHFSGTATYSKTFSMPRDLLGQNRRLYLDLGSVHVIAEVNLNGKNVGILWKPPFRADVTAMVRAGDNHLEVKVTNLWVNRLIGDEQLPADSKRLPQINAWSPPGCLAEWPQWLLEGKPSPSGRYTFSTWLLWAKDSPLLESGLLGPVRLMVSEPISIPF